MAIVIDQELCNGCKRCITVCPYGGVELREGKAVLTDRCTACGACIEVCKVEAIRSDIKEREIPDFSEYQGVWVFAEQQDGVLNRVTFELLGLGQGLAKELDQELSAVLLGHEVTHLVEELEEFGARTIYLAQHKHLTQYQTNPYAKVLSGIVSEHKPNIFLIGATTIGRDLAPRVSMRLNLGLTADCTELTIDPKDGSLLQTRPAFGGNVMATIKTPYSRPQMATVRPGVMEAKRKDNTGQSKVVEKKVKLLEKERLTEILEVVREKKPGVNLCDAAVIVAGGRGVGSKEGLKCIYSLAEALEGEVAGTRMVIEEGWLPAERQVGQTGQTVRPELYIACGISGAIQHRAGMLGSRYVIAINNDERAPIFEVADWGIVGNLHEIVPSLSSALRERKAG
ncbi:MAG: electron transfer flavoprotein subunit alpha [Deltaproteobacteria bacterium]|nr:electron transfer flavoprotein subunit alpha [Deltaproteobacteria bacterium]